MRNIRPGSAKFLLKKKTNKNVTWNLSNFGPAAIDFFDRSLSCCEYFHALSRSRRVHDFWINYTHVCAKENTKNSFWSVSTSTKATKKREKSIYSFCVPFNKKSPKLMMSVFCSNSLLHAPECRKCILRDPNFQNFPGEHAPAPP